MVDLSRAARLTHMRGARLAKGDPLSLPLVMASTYHLPGDPTGVTHQYGRGDNPTIEALEEALGFLEDAEAIAFPSGMAAISAALFGLLKAGDRILIPSDGYYTTRLVADRFLNAFGIVADQRATATFADGGFDSYRMVYVETPSNPMLDICDLEAIARDAHAAGAIVVVDNTTMTPYGQRPLDLGADIVVASDTKAPNGHSDALFGHVATRNSGYAESIRAWRKLVGGIPGPHEAWLVHRGLETLELRFDRMCTTAGIVAERLASHPTVSAVRYPGLPGDPSHNLARAQMSRFGFLVGFTLESADAAERFIAGCPLIRPSTSFGGVHSSAERRARWGDAVAPGYVRLSVGCEPAEDLWKAIEAALDALGD